MIHKLGGGLEESIPPAKVTIISNCLAVSRHFNHPRRWRDIAELQAADLLSLLRCLFL